MILASSPSIDLPLESLSLRQKWDLYGLLRTQLGISDKTNDMPDGHLQTLAEREARLESGEASLIELDDFVAEMRRRMP